MFSKCVPIFFQNSSEIFNRLEFHRKFSNNHYKIFKSSKIIISTKFSYPIYKITLTFYINDHNISWKYPKNLCEKWILNTSELMHIVNQPVFLWNSSKHNAESCLIYSDFFKIIQNLPKFIIEQSFQFFYLNFELLQLS